MRKILHSWPGTKFEGKLSAHMNTWQRGRLPAVDQPRELHPFITISREYGCDVDPLMQKLTTTLNERFRSQPPWMAYDRELLSQAAEALHVRRELVETLDGRYRDAMTELFDAILNRRIDEALVFRKLAEIVRSLALHGHAILVGRGAFLITKDMESALHVRLVAPRAWRVQRVAEAEHISREDAGREVDKWQHERDQFMRHFFVLNSEHPFLHDIVIDNSRFNLDQLAEIIIDVLTVKFGASLRCE